MTQKRKISVIGLGYVGLLAATAFAKLGKVIAFDINPTRVNNLKSGNDTNDEVSNLDLKNKNIYFTNHVDDITEADFHIISVPTPLDHRKYPDLSLLLNATKMIGKLLKEGDIVVYESSVYPGATEERCIPVLEQTSNMRCGTDFFVGFSPERINPADKIHTFENIPKIVSGNNEYALDIVAEEYAKVVTAGVHRVSQIRTAEAIKVIENIQRDINIAYMNEIAIILHKLKIDTSEVIAGMKTKWNFLPFQPGLVGGHCIGVNSYYLIYKAEEVEYHSPLLLASRHINENISKFIATQAIKQLIHLNIQIPTARIAILGFTYKENCSDLRDTKVIDIINELTSYGATVMVHDPIADTGAAKKEFNVDLYSWKDLTDLDAIIITVSHRYYIELDKNEYKKKLNRRGLIMDIKEILDRKDFADTEIVLWKL